MTSRRLSLFSTDGVATTLRAGIYCARGRQLIARHVGSCGYGRCGGWDGWGSIVSDIGVEAETIGVEVVTIGVEAVGANGMTNGTYSCRHLCLLAEWERKEG